MLKIALDAKFTIKDLGAAKYFLGLEITRTATEIYINRRKYVLDILKDAGLLSTKPKSIPFPRGQQLHSKESPLLDDPQEYRNIVDRLLYLSFTRPDLTYAVQQLSQHVQTPRMMHLKAAHHVLKYLKQEPSLGLFFPVENNFNITAYCDSNWVACPETRKSLTGYCIFFGSSLVSCKAKKQSTVSQSLAEAEYRSMAMTVCELQWILYILQDLKISYSLPIDLKCDNRAAMHIAVNPVFHERTKHLDIDCHMVRTKRKEGIIATTYVSLATQIADMFTKPLSSPGFQNLRSKLSLADAHQNLT